MQRSGAFNLVDGIGHVGGNTSFYTFQWQALLKSRFREGEQYLGENAFRSYLEKQIIARELFPRMQQSFEQQTGIRVDSKRFNLMAKLCFQNYRADRVPEDDMLWKRVQMALLELEEGNTDEDEYEPDLD